MCDLCITPRGILIAMCERGSRDLERIETKKYSCYSKDRVGDNLRHTKSTIMRYIRMHN